MLCVRVETKKIWKKNTHDSKSHASIYNAQVCLCVSGSVWLDLLWRLGTGAVVSTVSGVDWAPCVSNIWCAVVRCGASPHCHRIPSCKHNRVYTNTIDRQSIFRHSLTHWLWSLPHIFHLLWLSSISLSWSFALIHLWPTGSVNLCQYRTKHRDDTWSFHPGSRLLPAKCHQLTLSQHRLSIWLFIMPSSSCSPAMLINLGTEPWGFPWPPPTSCFLAAPLMLLCPRHSCRHRAMKTARRLLPLGLPRYRAQARSRGSSRVSFWWSSCCDR